MTIEGIERYLGSGMIKGIGPVYAKKLVDPFGEAVFEVIEEVPEKLTEIDGIGPVRAKRMASGWADQKAIREIMLFPFSRMELVRQGPSESTKLMKSRLYS